MRVRRDRIREAGEDATLKTPNAAWNRRASLAQAPVEAPVAYMDRAKFEALRRNPERGGVLTTLTSHCAFPEDVALYANPPLPRPGGTDADTLTLYVYRQPDGTTQVRAPGIDDAEVAIDMLNEALRAMGDDGTKVVTQ